jgi:hypothetical protein
MSGTSVMFCCSSELTNAFCDICCMCVMLIQVYINTSQLSPHACTFEIVSCETGWPQFWSLALNYNSLHGAGVLHEKLIVAQWFKAFPPFVGSGDPFSCLQEPTTGPYPEPDESCTHSSLFLQNSFYIILFRPPKFLSSGFSKIYHFSHACYLFHPSHPLFLMYDEGFRLWSSSSYFLKFPLPALSLFIFIVRWPSRYKNGLRAWKSGFYSRQEQGFFRFFTSLPALGPTQPPI